MKCRICRKGKINNKNEYDVYLYFKKSMYVYNLREVASDFIAQQFHHISRILPRIS